MYWRFAVMMVLCLVFSSAATATTVYRYAGNPFNSVMNNRFPGYSSAHSIIIKLEFAEPLPRDLPFRDIDADLISWSIRDGRTTLTDSSPVESLILALGTDSTGSISIWQIQASEPPPAALYRRAAWIESWTTTSSAADYAQTQRCISFDGSCTNLMPQWAARLDEPGTWTVVPEPTMGVLMILGMSGAELARRRRPGPPGRDGRRSGAR